MSQREHLARAVPDARPAAADALVAVAASLAFVAAALLAGCSSSAPVDQERALSTYVWPLPPDPPRIRLTGIFTGRRDVEAGSKLQKALIGAGSSDVVGDVFRKPHGVAIDPKGRLVVTDSLWPALLRLDPVSRRVDVFGLTGAIRLRGPLGVHVDAGGRIWVTDAELKSVVVFDEEGSVVSVYGKPGELQRPTDSAVSPDGSRLFVADSVGQRIVVFDVKSAKVVSSFGKRGSGDGEFNFPSAICFNVDGNLLVVDQMNARVQLYSPSGEYVDSFGSRGVGFAQFVRPKDVAVDDSGIIYVTDAAFSNVQLFDQDFNLLTFVGSGGEGPGQFQTPSGIGVRGDVFAIADQQNKRVQAFRYIEPRTGKVPTRAPKSGEISPSPAPPKVPPAAPPKGDGKKNP